MAALARTLLLMEPCNRPAAADSTIRARPTLLTVSLQQETAALVMALTADAALQMMPWMPPLRRFARQTRSDLSALAAAVLSTLLQESSTKTAFAPLTPEISLSSTILTMASPRISANAEAPPTALAALPAELPLQSPPCALLSTQSRLSLSQAASASQV